MTQWKNLDSAELEPEFDLRETLQFLLQAIPTAITDHLDDLRKPPGDGRRFHRQFVDHYLFLLEVLTQARLDGKLESDMQAQYDELMRRFLPIVEPLKAVHGRMPECLERETRARSTSLQ
jgi:hypothetical protein